MNQDIIIYYSTIPLKDIVAKILSLESTISEQEKIISDLQSEYRIYEKLS